MILITIEYTQRHCILHVCILDEHCHRGLERHRFDKNTWAISHSVLGWNTKQIIRIQGSWWHIMPLHARNIKQKFILTHYTTAWGYYSLVCTLHYLAINIMCFQITHFSFDDWEYLFILLPVFNQKYASLAIICVKGIETRLCAVRLNMSYRSIWSHMYRDIVRMPQNQFFSIWKIGIPLLNWDCLTNGPSFSFQWSRKIIMSLT